MFDQLALALSLEFVQYLMQMIITFSKTWNHSWQYFVTPQMEFYKKYIFDIIVNNFNHS